MESHWFELHASQDDVCDSDLDAEEEVDQEVELGGQSPTYSLCCLHFWRVEY